MRTCLPVLASAILALIGCGSAARGEEVVTNVEHLSGGVMGCSIHHSLAMSFTTGIDSSSWRLSSVQIRMFAQDSQQVVASVFICADDGGTPGALIQQFEPVDLLEYPSPMVSFKEPQPEIALEPSTMYWIVVKLSGPTSAYAHMGLANSYNESGMPGWSLGDGILRRVTDTSDPEGVWQTSSSVLVIAIDADAAASPPVVTSVSGCNDAGAVTMDCPAEGGIAMAVAGMHFTENTVVLIGGYPALAQEFESSRLIYCKLPPGTGAGLPVTVIDDEGMGLMPGAVSYFEPRCFGDADFSGAVDFDDIATSIAEWGTTCP